MGDPVPSLGQKGPMEKEIATHFSILAGKSHGQRSLVSYSPWGHKELGTTERQHMHAVSWDTLVRHLMNFNTAAKSV